MAGSLAVGVTFADGEPSAGKEVTLAGVVGRVGVTGPAVNPESIVPADVSDGGGQRPEPAAATAALQWRL
jgi:hypothetical protein